VLKNEVNRPGDFTRIPDYVRRQVVKTNCQICYQPYNRVYTIERNVIRLPKQHIEHLIPRRWLNEHGIFEHHVLNLLSVCNYCHGGKLKYEDRLYQGDVLSFLQGLKKMNYPVKRVVRFAESLGLREFSGIQI
jgi:hypothetical protein